MTQTVTFHYAQCGEVPDSVTRMFDFYGPTHSLVCVFQEMGKIANALFATAIDDVRVTAAWKDNAGKEWNLSIVYPH